MDNDENSSLGTTPILRAVRLSLGAALIAAAFLVLGSTGAFAASSNPNSSSSSPAASGGKGLISGLLNPVVKLVDTTVSQVPVVKDLVGSDTVSKITTPVTNVTDKVEGSVASLPVVGPVVGAVSTPVQNITNQVVAPYSPR
ncbi:hypothetical protein AL755_19440 [Arthrobacter sp. ERGS1:01]|uniref:hypothetical protein n=1 Tax=Arthrobacter sp. ERGS1:01 TaxID=1704044 RepID=UPI0006CB7974|nr:hypothetical protein [Arthrobacter sp. ERGS1:01]ALE07140.1 hypothetical protein AL755_19440 [Arthrobacter sp. ERGS1:01]